MNQHRVIFVTGSTATGKSDWALRVAEEAKAIIVNCDSVQIYRGVDIASGMPTLEERARAPHYLYDLIEAPNEMTAGIYREDFLKLLKSLPPGQKILVVGGTGFYFQALEKGMFDVPDVPVAIQENVRAEIEEEGGPERLHAELQKGDPATAAVVLAVDTYRLTRALELLRAGVILSEFKKNFRPEPFPYPLLKTGVLRERTELRDRIARRTRRMIDAGILDETRALLDRGLRDWAPVSSVGTKECVRALDENLSKEWLQDEISLRTGQLAKRQGTWFKRDRDIQTFSGDEGESEFRQTCLRFFESVGTLGSL